jgi:hypothetical protein
VDGPNPQWGSDRLVLWDLVGPLFSCPVPMGGVWTETCSGRPPGKKAGRTAVSRLACPEAGRRAVVGMCNHTYT